MKLILGTRGSKLALAQSQWVARCLEGAAGGELQVELKIISTRGDRVQDRPLAKVGGKGLFTAELEAELREGTIDLAVHSLKDLPTEDPEGLTLGGVPVREDPRDALVGAALSALPSGSVVGTGSLRRAAALRQARPDLTIKDIRGNVDTRLRKRDEGAYDAVVLAVAGMKRLGIERDDVHPLPVDQMVPAVGQGALGIQCRAGDERVLSVLATIDHPDTRRAVAAERAFLAAYGGGCNVPAACHARIDGERIHLVAVAQGSDGTMHGAEASGPDGVALGAALGAQLKA